MIELQKIKTHIEARIFAVTQNKMQSQESVVKEISDGLPVEQFAVSKIIDLHKDREVLAELKAILEYVRGIE